MAGSEPLRPDLCIVGGGTAGTALAMAAAGLGLSCIVIEKRLPLGRSQARDMATDILVSARPGQDLSALRAHMGESIARLAPAYGAERLRAMGLTVIEGAGRFLDARTLEVGGTRVQAHRFVLATGAQRRIEKRLGLDLVRTLTPEAALRFEGRPERIAIMGNTTESLELAHAFRRLGCRVTLIGQPGGLDEELGAFVLGVMARDGVELRGAPVERIEPHRTGAIIHMTDQFGAIAASHLILADARMPYTELLGLKEAGVRRDDEGLVLRADLRTTNPRVFAIGDVVGRSPAGLAGIPAQIGLVLRAGFFRQPTRFRPEQGLRLVRTDPAIAEIGLREAEARAIERSVRLYRAPLSENAHAVALGEPQGYIKVIATPAGRIVGAGVVGRHAAEIIAPWGLALAHNLSLDAMATAPYLQPSLAELSRQAALGHVVGRMKGPWVKRTLRLMKRLG